MVNETCVYVFSCVRGDVSGTGHGQLVTQTNRAGILSLDEGKHVHSSMLGLGLVGHVENG